LPPRGDGDGNPFPDGEFPVAIPIPEPSLGTIMDLKPTSLEH
jgi:hypothetical protein